MTKRSLTTDPLKDILFKILLSEFGNEGENWLRIPQAAQARNPPVDCLSQLSVLFASSGRTSVRASLLHIHTVNF